MGRRLSDSFAKKVAPTGKDTVHRDDATPGLGLRVTPAGAKRWVVSCRVNGRARRRYFGDPAIVDYKSAREAARKLLARVALGEDPWREEEERAAAEAGRKTFAEVLEMLWAERERVWEPNTLISYKTARGKLLPVFGDRAIDCITRAEVKAFHNSLVNTPHAANRALSLLSVVFTYAVDEEEILTANPVARVKKFVEYPRERVPSDAEFRNLWAALREEPAPLPTYFRLLALSAARKSELWVLRWDQVSLESRTITLPARSRRNKRPHVIELNEFARADLAALARNGGYVFGTNDMGKPWMTKYRTDAAWKRITKAAKVDGVQIHDLRRHVTSTAVNSGESIDVVAKLIGDSVGTTARHYAHINTDTVRRAAVRNQDAIVAKAEGKPAPVVPIRGEAGRD